MGSGFLGLRTRRLIPIWLSARRPRLRSDRRKLWSFLCLLDAPDETWPIFSNRALASSAARNADARILHGRPR